jgi:TetR/AcrR family transcriptional regulator
MLEAEAERVTTALLAARLDVSEAALYRHFASKAQMFEGLIEFIEQSVFGLVNQIAEREDDGRAQARRAHRLLPSRSRHDAGDHGDALVSEDERYGSVNQLVDRLEASLRRALAR